MTGLPAPKAPGQAETFTVTVPGRRHDLLLRHQGGDEALPANISEVSNCAAAKSSVLARRSCRTGLNGYTGCLDTYLLRPASTDYGTSDRMTVCGYGDGNYQRGILRFDLSSLRPA